MTSTPAVRDVPLAFTIGDPTLISGLSEAVLGMQPGGTRRCYIPQALAYDPSLRPATTAAPAVPVI